MNNNLIGKKFNNLMVVEKVYINNKSWWKCKCDCGNFKNVKTSDLKRGHVKSCGCIFNGKKIKNTHNNRIYNIWYNMKRRCYQKEDKNYKNYGKRGIRIRADWLNDFSNFYEWAINNGYEENLTIERIDVNGNYEPNNCKWITLEKQLCNQRRNVFYCYKGETKCLSELCKEHKMPYTTVRARLLSGKTIQQALEIPIDKTKRNKNYKRKE